MTRDITVTLYKFDELSDAAKEKARHWWRESESFDPESVFDDAETVAGLLGISFDQKTVGLMNGGTRQKPTIYYSGFSSQGDGACFEGSYQYAKGCRKAVRDYAPTDRKLHAIADGLTAIQRKSFYHLTASMSHSGQYYHSGCMRVSVDDSRDSWRLTDDADSEITDQMRYFADWIYHQLETEYEHTMSDENVDESIRANEYEFDESGEIA